MEDIDKSLEVAVPGSGQMTTEWNVLVGRGLMQSFIVSHADDRD